MLQAIKNRHIIASMVLQTGKCITFSGKYNSILHFNKQVYTTLFIYKELFSFVKPKVDVVPSNDLDFGNVLILA